MQANRLCNMYYSTKQEMVKYSSSSLQAVLENCAEMGYKVGPRLRESRLLAPSRLRVQYHATIFSPIMDRDG